MVTIEKHILNNYFNINEIISIVSYGNGHINDTYLVTTRTEKFILQKVNGNVFIINNLIHNYDYIESSFEKNQARNQLFPKFKKNNDRVIHSFDSLGNAWRVVYFIEDCPYYPISPNIEVSEIAGMTMGRFQLFLEEQDPDLFKDTISNFHNPKHRISEFYRVLQSAENEVKQVASKDISFAIENSNIADHMSSLLDSNTLPIRVTHNDTKLDNILFDIKNNQNYVIDLDTVMKGSILFDFGDMVRSITSLANEDEKDLSNVNFNIDHFRALCNGYFSEVKKIITKPEADNILAGIKCIIYIQGIRFLTDYLAGNTYYKVDYSTHNLVRCRTQFRLLMDILDNSKEVSEIINRSLL